jgi:hypothetical protein
MDQNSERSKQTIQGHHPHHLRELQPGDLEQRLEEKKRIVQKENALPPAPLDFVPPDVLVQQSNRQRVWIDGLKRKGDITPARETFINTETSSSSSSSLKSLKPSTWIYIHLYWRKAHQSSFHAGHADSKAP